MAPAFPFLDGGWPLAFSHAGGGHEGIENTWPAFEATVGLGYRYLETDTVATRDGVLLAFHDPYLDRMTDRRGTIAALDYAEVSAARVFGVAPIPRLDEVLAAWPGLRVNIEPKTDAAVEPLARLLRSAAAIERVCVGSFVDARIRRLRALLGPSLCTSMGPRPTAALRFASWKLPVVERFVRATGAGCVQVPVRHGRVRVVDQRFVDTAHALGLQVHVWTIDGPLEMVSLLDLGVDGIMTDRPSVLKQVLVDRGAWHGSA